MAQLAKKFFGLITGTYKIGDDQKATLGGAPLFLEKRLNPRHSTVLSRIARVILEDGTVLDVKDISFGGVALFIEKSTLQKCAANLKSLPFRIEINHHSVDAKAALVHSRKSITSFCFIHSDDKTLIFLRPFMEFARLGRTFKDQPIDETERELHGPNYYVYAGDLGTKLFLWRNISGTIEKCKIIFNSGHTVHQANYEDGRLTVDDSSKPTRRDLPILEQALFLVIGMLEHLNVSGLSVVAEAFRETIDSIISRKL